MSRIPLMQMGSECFYSVDHGRLDLHRLAENHDNNKVASKSHEFKKTV